MLYTCFGLCDPLQETNKYLGSPLLLAFTVKIVLIRLRVFFNSRFIYIYIYIYSLSLSINPYHPSPPAVLPNYILCTHRADVNEFLLVSQHWVCPCFSSSVPHMLFVLLGWSLRWKVSGRTTVISRGCCFLVLFKIALSIFVKFP